MKNKKSLGQIAFESLFNTIKWDGEDAHVKGVWNKVAKAVEREVRRRMKAPKKIGKKGRR